MFSSIVSASKAWIVFLVLGLIVLFVMVLIILSKKRDEKNKKAWEENVRRNKILQKQMEDQKGKAFFNQLDKQLDSIYNVRIDNIMKLYRSKKCTSVVENFFKSAMENRFYDLDLYIVPKSFFKVDNNAVTYNNSLALKYSELLCYITEKVKIFNEKLALNENYDVEKTDDEIILDTYEYLLDVFGKYTSISLKDDVFVKAMSVYNLKNIDNGIESINSLFLGLTGLGVIKNFSLEDWYTFVGLKQEEFNTNRFFELCNKFDIDFEEIRDEIYDFISKLLDLNDNNCYNYFISHQNNALFNAVHDVLDKNGADNLAEFLLLIIRHCSNSDYKTCIDLSKSILDVYDKIEMSKVKASNFINGVKKNDSITISDVDSMNGVEFEEFVAKMFDKLGYTTEVTKASGDQGVDVIAKKNGKVLGIQAKCYSGVVGNHAIMEVVAGMKYYECNCCVVVTNSTFTAAAKELAKANRVELWDRNDLKEQMELLEM